MKAQLFLFHTYLYSRSSQSSKNRRKHERKLLSLKEGSPHEDVALMQALHNEITACLVMRGK